MRPGWSATISNGRSERVVPLTVGWRDVPTRREIRGWPMRGDREDELDFADVGRWHPSGSGSTRSGTTAMASGCLPTPRSVPTASSAACRNCCRSRAYWYLTLAVALWLSRGVASAQTNPGSNYDRAAVIQAICRQYAAVQRVLPYDTMYCSMHVCEGILSAGFLAVAQFPWLSRRVAGPCRP